MPGFATITPPERVFRLARTPDPWEWPDWAYVGRGRSDNRWDDPQGVYRVLYACTERLGTFVETLARFRPDPAVVAGLAAIVGDDEGTPPGSVPRSWFTPRVMGTGLLVGTFVDIGHADSLAILHQALAARLVHHRIRELDGAAIRAQAPREFTQEVSRHIYERALDGGAAFAGIHYQSRMGDNLHNWAIFERPGALAIRPGPSEQITELDADFLRALDLLGLTLQP